MFKCRENIAIVFSLRQGSSYARNARLCGEVFSLVPCTPVRRVTAHSVHRTAVEDAGAPLRDAIICTPGNRNVHYEVGLLYQKGYS